MRASVAARRIPTRIDDLRADHAAVPGGHYVVATGPAVFAHRRRTAGPRVLEPGRSAEAPYDDTGWSFPELFAVDVARVTDPASPRCPHAAVSRHDARARRKRSTGKGSSLPAEWRQRPRPTAVSSQDGRHQIAEQPFDAAADSGAWRAPGRDVAATASVAGSMRHFERGTLLVRGENSRTLRMRPKLWASRYDAGPTVAMHPARAARVAVVHTWSGYPDRGVVARSIRRHAIPYDYISVQDVAKMPESNARYDVILFPPVNGSVQAIVERHANVAQRDAMEAHTGNPQHRRLGPD